MTFRLFTVLVKKDSCVLANGGLRAINMLYRSVTASTGVLYCAYPEPWPELDCFCFVLMVYGMIAVTVTRLT